MISVQKLGERFPNATEGDSVQVLLDQFSEYQLTPLDEPPVCQKDTDIEKFWGEMSTVEDIFNDRKRFNVLAKLAKALLVLPNSNADCERAFSIVKKIHTEFRSELKNDTLCSLLSCKCNQNHHCYGYAPSA